VLEPASQETKAGNGHFQTFQVSSFVPAMFWFLVVCVVKVWSDLDRKKAAEKVPGAKTQVSRYYLRRQFSLFS